MMPHLEIPLSKGGVTLVDECDAEIAMRHTWWLLRGYAYTTIKERTFYLHRMILETPKGLSVDHANRNPLDNRRSNLRVATQSQQGANTVRRLSNTGYRGVHTRNNSFYSLIQCEGKNYRNYKFKTAIEAALDYDRMAIEKFGAFAILNFPVSQ
jgi:hypothetical protein